MHGTIYRYVIIYELQSSIVSTITTEFIEFYIPEYCIQGDRIPFYVLWDQSQDIKISLSLPSGLELHEVYNINSKELRKEKDLIVAQNFEIAGYFGGVIKSKLYDEASTTKLVKFLIYENSYPIKSFEQMIELFRPDMKIHENTSSITVFHTKNKQITNKQLPLVNHGKGTGIVRINISDESEIKEGIPEGFQEFKEKFLKDLKEVFVELMSKFPQYKEIIGDLMIFVDDPLPFKSDKLNHLKTTTRNLERAFDNNNEFLEEFSQSVTTAFLKNVSILTNVTSFLAFIKSISKNKIIFIDAMKVLKISTKPQKLKASLLVTDLTKNIYEPINLPDLTLKADKECTIPIYQIFNTMEGTNDG